MTRSCLAVLFCVSCVASGAALAGSDPRVKEIKLSVEGRIGSIVGVDLNGDSLKDVLVLSVTGRSDAARRLGSVFVQKTGKSFSSRPDLVWELPRSIVALDPFTDDLPSSERGTIFSIDTDGIYAHRLAADASKMTSQRVLAYDLSHLPAQKEATLLFDFAASWSGGVTEFVVPAFPDPLLLRPQEAGARGAIALKIPPEPHYSAGSADRDGTVAPLSAAFEFPRLVASGPSGEGRNSLLALKEPGVDVLDLQAEPAARGDGGRERRVVVPRNYPLDVLSDDEVNTKRCWQESRLKALMRGARMDVIATVTCEKGGLFDYDGRVLVFKSRPDGSFPQKADQTFQIENALYWDPSIRDLDGDGRIEITLPAVKLGIWGMIRAATTHKVAFDFVTVGLGPSGAFDPAKTWKDPVTLRLSSGKYDVPVILFAKADADKLVDLIVGTGASEVCVYKGIAGNPDRRFASSATLCFQADPYAAFNAADLDNDGKDELIVEQMQSKAAGQFSIIQFP